MDFQMSKARVWVIRFVAFVAAIILIGAGNVLPGPKYYIRLYDVGGVEKTSDTTGAAAQFDLAGVEFVDELSIPGQRGGGRFVLTLLDTRDARYHYLRDTYNLFDYEQRVLIYDTPDKRGDPIFGGVITALPQDLNGALQVQGVGFWRMLAVQRLRRGETLDGSASAIAQSLLQTYSDLFKDNFNRTTGLGANWTISAGAWGITDNYLLKTTDATGYIQSVTSYQSPFWQDSKLSFDVYFPSGGTLSDTFNFGFYDSVYVYGFAIDPFYYSQTMNLSANLPATGNARRFLIQYDTWNHCDVYYSLNSDGTVATIIHVNGIEMLSDTSTATSNNATIWFNNVASSSATRVRVDNVVFYVLGNAIEVGAMDSGNAYSQTFNADTRLDALNSVLDAEQWDARLRAGAGVWAYMDSGANVGRDMSGVLILEEGENIVALSKSRTSDELATSILVYGQSQDDASANFIANDLDAFDDYGIIEADYSDPRVSDVALARTIGNNELARRAQGNVSLSGTIIDESALFEQPAAVWGASTWGDARWGGRPRLRVGDRAYLKSPTLNIDRSVKIVSIVRRAGTNAIDVIFDYFDFRASRRNVDTRKLLFEQIRAYTNRLNTQTVRLALSGTTAQSWYLTLRGQIQKTYIDIRSASWAGAVTVAIDGVDRTSALFGAATISADAHATDTNYLVLSGEHYITLTPSVSVTLDISISTKLLA